MGQTKGGGSRPSSGGTNKTQPASCNSSMYQTPNISDQQVYAGDLVNISIPSFSLDPANCGATYSFYSTASSSVIYFNNLTFNLTVDTSQGNSLVGHYLCTVFAQDSNPTGTSQFIGYATFIVDVLINCDYGNLTMKDFSPIWITNYMVGSQAITLSFQAMTPTISGCIVDQDLEIAGNPDAPIDSDIFTWDGTNLKLAISTSDTSKDGVYHLNYTGQIQQFTRNNGTDFYVNICDCNQAVITPATDLTTADIYVFGGKYTFSFSEFLVDNSSTKSHQPCLPFSYSAEICDAGCSTPTQAFYSYNSKTFTFQTDDMKTIGSYTYRVNGLLPIGKSDYFEFTLNIIDPCLTDVITVPKIAATKVSIADQTTVDVVVSKFTELYNAAHNNACGPFTYSASLQGGMGWPAFISFNSDTITLSFDETQAPYTSGTYNIQVTGCLSSNKNYPCNNVIVTFNYVGCDQDLVYPSITQNQTFYVYDSGIDTYCPSGFTDKFGVCGSFYYTAEASTDGGQSFNSLPDQAISASLRRLSISQSLVSFSSGGGICFSTDPTQITVSETYLIKLTGQLDPEQNGVSNSTIFNITLVGCDQTVVSYLQIANKTYTYNQLSETFGFEGFLDSFGVCGQFTYSSNLGGGSSLPSPLISFNYDDEANTYTYSIEPSAITQTITYTVYLIADLPYPGPQTTMKFNINFIGCDSTIITPSSVADQTFYYNQVANTYQLTSSFTESLGVCGAFTFSASLTNSQGPSLPSLISFDASDPDALLFTIQTDQILTTITYPIKITACLTSPNQVCNSTSVFNIILKACDKTVISSTPIIPSIPTLQYSYTTSNVQFGFNQWSESFGTCGSFTYSVSLSDNSNLPLYLTFDYTSLNFNADQTLISSSQTLSIKITGILASPGGSLDFIFSLTVKGCDQTIVTTTTKADQTFQILTGMKTFNIVAFTESMGTCGPFTYTSSQSNNSPLPTLVTFDSSTLQFTVDTSLITSTITYSLIVKGALNSPGPTKQISFRLILLGCDSTTVTKPTISTQTFTVNDASNTITIPNFVESFGVCGSFSYSSTLSSGSALPTFITFDATTHTYSIDTSQIVTTQTLTLSLKGQLTSPGPTSTLSFSISFKACDTSIITAPAIPNKSFTVNDVTNTFTITAFTESLGRCGSFTYTSTQSNNSPLPSFLSFDSLTRTFTVNTNALVLTTSYTIKVVGTLSSPGGSSTKTFTLNIIACDTTVITASSVSAQSFSVGSASNTFTFTSFTESLGRCTPFTYTATQSNGAALPSPLFSISSGTQTFTINLASITSTTTYSVKLVGSLAAPGGSAFTTFNVNLQNCDTTTITAPSISSHSYNYNTGTQTFTMSAFTESFGYCGSFTYTITQSNGAAKPALLSFNSGTLVFSVDTTQITATTSYTIKVVGSLASPGPSATKTFTLSLTACDSTIISAVTIPTQTFHIYDSINTFSFTSWSESLGFCTPFTYTVDQSNGLAIPSLLAFNSGTRTFTVTIAQILINSVYTIRVTGSLTSPGPSMQKTFTLNLISCQSTVITATTQIDQSFTAGDFSITTYTILPFTESFSVCGSFTYSATLSDGSTLPSMITFNPTTKKFTVDVTNIPNTVDYTIKLIGSLGALYPSSSTNFIFHLTGCSSTIITAPSDFSPSYQFTFGDLNQAVIISAFTEAFSVCGPFTYTLELVLPQQAGRILQSTTTTMPYFLSFSQALRTITIDTFRIYNSGSYTLNFMATLPNGLSKHITFVINIIGCEPGLITKPPSYSYFYTIGESRLEIPINSITVNNTKCPYTTIETVKQALYPKTKITQASTNLPEFMLQSSYYHELWLQTNDNSKSGEVYTFFVNIAIHFDPLYNIVTKYTNFEFTVTINGSSFYASNNTSPPYFENKLQSTITIYELTTANYHIPKYTDTQSLRIYATPIYVDQAYYFTKFRNDTFIFKPQHQDRGNYTISINLTDDDPLNPLTNQYSFQLIILPINPQIIEIVQIAEQVAQIQQESNPVIAQSQAEELYLEYYQKYYSVSRVVETNETFHLNGVIQYVDLEGNVKIKLKTKSLFVPMIYSFINSAILHLYIVKNNGKVYTDFTWNITNFTSSYLFLKLKFEDPSSIASSQRTDNLFVQFLQNGYFFEVPALKYVPKNYLIQTKLPPIIRQQGHYAFTDQFGSFLKYTILLTTMGSVGLGLFLPFSSAGFWGILNTLQLILHIPLFELAIPSQLAQMFAILIQMANFNFIPLESLTLKLLPWFEESYPYSNSFNYLGYGTCDQIINLGNTILNWFIGFSSIIYLLIFAILKRRYKKLQKFYEEFRDTVFFNCFLRIIIQTYLLTCIATITSYLAGQDIQMEKILRLIFLMFVVGVPIMCIIFGVNYETMKPRTRKMISSLFEDLDIECFWSRQYHTIFMLRRLVFSIIAIFIVGHGEFQCILYLVLSILQLTYIVNVWPMELQRANRIEVFNEATILMCGYCLILLTDFVEDSNIHWNVGWTILLITVFNCLVNFLVALYDLLGQVGDYLAENCSKDKFRKFRRNQIIALKQEKLDSKRNERNKEKKWKKLEVKSESDQVQPFDENQFELKHKAAIAEHQLRERNYSVSDFSQTSPNGITKEYYIPFNNNPSSQQQLEDSSMLRIRGHDQQLNNQDLFEKISIQQSFQTYSIKQVESTNLNQSPTKKPLYLAQKQRIQQIWGGPERKQSINKDTSQMQEEEYDKFQF